MINPTLVAFITFSDRMFGFTTNTAYSFIYPYLTVLFKSSTQLISYNNHSITFWYTGYFKLSSFRSQFFVLSERNNKSTLTDKLYVNK